MSKITINTLQKMKNKEKIAMITAYDSLFAKIFNEDIDIILVGDSLHMSFGGNNETLGLSLNQMIYHAQAVKKAATHPYLIVDMPFGSVETPKKALKSAIKVYMQTGCDAVKIEGGKEKAKTIELLSKNGIAVVAHIGLRPQMSRAQGGYKIDGKSSQAAKALLEDAKALEKAGAVLLVIEGTISDVAKEITKSISIPTIGIGSGVDCDGQVLVWSDAFGFFDDFKPKFVKRYLDGAKLLKSALKDYVDDVKKENFPTSEYEYKV